MTFKRLLRISGAVLGSVIVAYITLGNFYAYQVSQREETRHDRAVAKAEPQSYDDWLALRHDQPIVDWRYRNAKKHIYRVRIYADRGYIASVYRGSMSGQPARFVEGIVRLEDWRQLRAAGDALYDRRNEISASVDEKAANVTLEFAASENGLRVTYRYSTDAYDQLPELYRVFDTQMFAAMQSSDIKPHHGHARKHVAVSYGPEELPNLLRGLRSDREDLFKPAVDRMVAIGEPALPALIGVLRAGRDDGYRRTDRLAMVIDAIAALDDIDGKGFPLIKALAAAKATIPGRRALKKQAQSIVDRFEIDAYLDDDWAVSTAAEKRLRSTDLSPTRRDAAEAEFTRLGHRRDEDRASARTTLIAMGPEILPLVLERLRYDRYERNRYNAELLDVLVTLGGPDACLFAIRQDVLEGQACIEPLRKLGATGLPGLLKLLESEQRLARVKATDALKTPDFGAFTPQYAVLLQGKVDAYRDTTSDAVRELQADAVTSLATILQAHAAADRPSINALLQAAVDAQQTDDARIAALQALAALGPVAAIGRNELQELVGYASGRVRNELLATLRALPQTSAGH